MKNEDLMKNIQFFIPNNDGQFGNLPYDVIGTSINFFANRHREQENNQKV